MKCSDCGDIIGDKFTFCPSIEVPGAFAPVCPPCAQKMASVKTTRWWKRLWNRLRWRGMKCAECGEKIFFEKSGPLKGRFTGHFYPIHDHPGLWAQFCESCAARGDTSEKPGDE